MPLWTRGSLSGLTDKLYWRETSPGSWHCFKSQEGGGYISLCRRFTYTRSGGQEIMRPKVFLRCGICDGREMKRRGHDESMPESPPRPRPRHHEGSAPNRRGGR